MSEQERHSAHVIGRSGVASSPAGKLLTLVALLAKQEARRNADMRCASSQAEKDTHR